VEALVERFAQLTSERDLIHDVQSLISHLNSSRLLSPKIKWSLFMVQSNQSGEIASSYGSALHEIIEALEGLEDDLGDLLVRAEALRKLMDTAVASPPD
jgi:hypothetical protein